MVKRENPNESWEQARVSRFTDQATRILIQAMRIQV
jgi:hypothetical protein